MMSQDTSFSREKRFTIYLYIWHPKDPLIPATYGYNIPGDLKPFPQYLAHSPIYLKGPNQFDPPIGTVYQPGKSGLIIK